MIETPVIPLLDAALRGTLIGLFGLLSALMWRDRSDLWVVRVACLLAAGLCVQVISSAPSFEAHVPWFWQAPLVAISVGNGVLFWVLAQTLFNDDFRPMKRHVGAWVFAAAVSGIQCAWGPKLGSALSLFMAGLQRALPILFAVLAAWAAASHWREDLVEARRKLRLFIVVTGSAYSVMMVALRLASPSGRLSAWAAMFDVLLLLIIVMGMAWQMLQLGTVELLGAPAAGPALPEPAPVPKPVAAPTSDPAEERLAALLEHLMTQERAYRTEDLTVGSLARTLAVPEYRLRRLINQRLGHRNFNAFVNGYRLTDACTALADAAQRDVPVLTIALDAGFQSIGPFNRAFKAATGLTPSEYRRDKLAQLGSV